MRAVAAKSSTLENAAKSQGKTAQNLTQPAAPVTVSGTPGGIPLLQRKSLCPCDGGCPRCSGVIQPKLTIGRHDDEYEEEADRVADQVMRMPDPHVQRQEEEPEEEEIQAKPIGDQITPLVQRQEESEEEEEEPVQAKGISKKSPPVTTGLGHRIQSIKGGGQPLSAKSRAFFEPRFGRDFSRVRVHNDSTAAALARSVNARAFTLGTDIVFNSGAYVPGTVSGRRLMAHELTHVVQQRNGLRRLQRTTDRVVGCYRDGAFACLIHLHGNEVTALDVARNIHCRYCTNLVYIDHPDRRLVYVDVPGHDITCCADPNRIFQDDAVRDSGNWSTWNSNEGNGPCTTRCRNISIKSNAQQAVIDFRTNELEPKIRECQRPNLSGEEQNESENSQDGRIPMIVFHNNRDTDVNSDEYRQRIGTRRESLNIYSYCPGHWEANQGATELDEMDVTGSHPLIRVVPNTECVTSTPSVRPILNPHIEDSQNPDDFILVTRLEDFVDLVGLGRNVVLQAQPPPTDGSLSVVSSNERYFNIETRRSHQTEQLVMGEEILQYVLGRISAPCRSPRTRNDTGCPDCT